MLLSMSLMLGDGQVPTIVPVLSAVVSCSYSQCVFTVLKGNGILERNLSMVKVVLCSGLSSRYDRTLYCSAKLLLKSNLR